MEDGSGLEGLIPSLVNSKHLGNLSMLCIMKNGINDTIFKDSTYLVKEMPAFKRLSATEMANIVNYINSMWSPSFKEMTILEINQGLKDCD